MKLRFRSAARADIAKALAYLDDRSPQARAALEARLKETFEVLRGFPLAGGATTRQGVRRILVAGHPDAVFYRATDDAVVVIALRHTARRPIVPERR